MIQLFICHVLEKALQQQSAQHLTMVKRHLSGIIVSLCIIGQILILHDYKQSNNTKMLIFTPLNLLHQRP